MANEISLESLEVVESLHGVDTVFGFKDGKLVRVPKSLIMDTQRSDMEELLAKFRAGATDIGSIPIATSLAGITALPVVQDNKSLVRVPPELFGSLGASMKVCNEQSYSDIAHKEPKLYVVTDDDGQTPHAVLFGDTLLWGRLGGKSNVFPLKFPIRF